MKKNRFICFLGPDGSGKTTIIERFVREASTSGHFDGHSISVLHFRPEILPNIRTLLSLGLSPEREQNFLRPHRAKPSGRLGSLLRLLYYFADYWLGYYLKIVPLLRKEKIVIFDRYYFDLLADPRRTRINLPINIRKKILQYLPSPDICFYIKVPECIALQRKNEIEVDTMREINSMYMKIAEYDPKFHVISNEGDLDVTVKKITKLISRHF